jgi:hypothetical protein
LLTFARLYLEDQQPRQMLLILRSTVLFSSVIAASTLPDPADLPEPVVTPLSVLTPRPDDWAVPAVLVPGAGGDASLDGFCAPLGSSPELFNPPGLAGPGGTPVMPCVPAPAEPALGDPAALLLPAEGPLAAPPALGPPALAPPPVPPLLPLPLWASDMAGDIRIVNAATAATDNSFIGNLLFGATMAPGPSSCWNDSRARSFNHNRSTPGVIALAQIDRLRRRYVRQAQTACP